MYFREEKSAPMTTFHVSTKKKKKLFQIHHECSVLPVHFFLLVLAATGGTVLFQALPMGNGQHLSHVG